MSSGIIRYITSCTLLLLSQVNIIPKWVNFTVDTRCKRQEFRQQIVRLIEQRVLAVCEKRDLNCTVSRSHDAAPVSPTAASSMAQAWQLNFSAEAAG